MAAYAAGEADVLVSTSVIEVGVDVANATVMVIVGARRFGLSQLHQLRGRVGRGADDSYCFLLADDEDDAALERLALFARTTDGFALAEADLRARGEGQLFGERQSGLGDLRGGLAAARPAGCWRRPGRSPGGSSPTDPGAGRPRVTGSWAEAVDAQRFGRADRTGWSGCERGTCARHGAHRRRGARGGTGSTVPAGGVSAAYQRDGAGGDLRRPGLGRRARRRSPRPRPVRRHGSDGARGAVPRGAGRCVFVEADPARRGRAARATSQASGLRSDRARVVLADYRTGPADPPGRARRRFDLLFVDPPYRMLPEVEVTLAPLLPALLADGRGGGHRGSARSARGRWGSTSVFDRRYGDTAVTMVRGGSGVRVKTALCPGTYDPVTVGHLDIIARCSAHVRRGGGGGGRRLLPQVAALHRRGAGALSWRSPPSTCRM